MNRIFPFLSLLFLFNIISCSIDSESATDKETLPDLAATVQATDSDGNLYEVGFNQVSSINQDPFVRKSNGREETLWYMEHEKSEVDVRANFVLVDAQDFPWVVFSVVGGSYSEDYITKKATTTETAFSGVYQSGYGNGGGPKVSVIARLNPDTGTIEKASYITARKNDGKTNGLNIKGIEMVDGKLAFTAESVAWPPTIGTSYERYPGITDSDRVDGVFKMYYEIDAQLKGITKAELMK